MTTDRLPPLPSPVVAAPRAASPSPVSRGQPSLRSYPRTLVEAALERVVGSDTFRRSQRHRHFLRHVVGAALADQHEQLKEVIIGLEVFGRDLATYDPRSDPIVRVEAGRLREKLVRFYANEGDGEAFEITIPVGGYAPSFVPRATDRVRAADRRSIAILPFANLSGHADDTTFSIGLADQLIDTLGRVPALKVVARVSALEAGERALPVRTAGRLLGVGHVVEGSIQRSGSRLRCIARLSRAKDGVRLWSRRFDDVDAAAADLFDFQDAIADAVLQAVTSSLADDGGGTRDRAPVRTLSTRSSEARDLFERARYVAQQGSIDGYTRAIAMLERAVVLDPAFAQAHSHLGAARAYLAPYVFAPSVPSFAKVKEAALRALELDPLDGEAHALLAVITHRIEAGWTAAEPLFIGALRIAPNSTLAHTTYSWGLVFNGRHEEAIRHARIALELDPLNITQRAHNARLYSYAGRYELALSELHAVLDLDPDHLYAQLVLGIIHLSMGNPDDAMPCFERVADEGSRPLQRAPAHDLRARDARRRGARPARARGAARADAEHALLGLQRRAGAGLPRRPRRHARPPRAGRAGTRLPVRQHARPRAVRSLPRRRRLRRPARAPRTESAAALNAKALRWSPYGLASTARPRRRTRPAIR